jgi:hypothetical protein
MKQNGWRIIGTVFMEDLQKNFWKYIENSIYSYGADGGKRKVFKMPLCVYWFGLQIGWLMKDRDLNDWNRLI